MNNSGLNIDMTTYLTILFGQFTMYGILLTFYQFVSSKNGKKTYLGYNLNEYFIKKNVRFLNIISSKFIYIFFTWEILYKPVLTIYRDSFDEEIIRVLNFIWFVGGVCFFLIFVFIFVQSANVILKIDTASNIKTNGYLIYEINKDFLRRTSKERMNRTNIDLLKRKLENLNLIEKFDENIEFQSGYNGLIYDIFDRYIKQKQRDNLIIEKNHICLRKMNALSYNSKREGYLLQKIIDGEYFILDKENLNFIKNFCFKLLELNMERAKLEGYSKIRFDKYENLLKEQMFDTDEWKTVMLKIYLKIADENKEGFVTNLYVNINLNYS